MALVVKDRVQETTGVVGTGTMTLAGAVLGYQTFATIGNGNTTYYTIVDLTAGDWEVGIGTYTASGTTLSRDTVLSSSNAGSLVSFGVGTKNVFVTYPSERSVYLDSPGSYPVQNTFNTLNATTATLTAGTVSTTPSSGTDLANKSYVDTVAAAGIHYHTPVYVESPNTAGNLNAAYNQPGGPGVGVGATLTNAGAKAALTIDGILMTTTKRVLIYNQTNAYENGVYTVTTVGTPDPGGTNWVLTRATDADTYAPSSPNSLGQGDAFFVTNGDTGAGEGYVCTTVGVITFGTTAITFSQFSAAQVYNAGTGLNLSPSTTFNISNTGVSASTYGSASQVPVMAINAQGQVTSATNTAIAIAAGAVSGLAASATTDTTNASNISSGTLGTSRLSGSYTGITGTGALAAGSLAAGFTAVSAPLGGTGQTSYTVGDLLYADTASTLAKLPDVAVGNALISGGVGAAPSWGKVGLATAVSGTLPVANGGTGVTSSTGTGSVVLSSSPSLTTPTIGGAGATFSGSTSGTTVFKAAATAGTTTITMPATTGTVALTSDIPTVNNGTLTMGVSGTGLSGSATFTANQSGASSFTVTSNATNLNTASTIVARDASGNFSAGTVTATLSGNASTATTASNTNAVAGFSVNQYNANNLRLYSATTGATGLLGVDSAGTFRYQLYGDGTNYGFLNGAWAGWDMQKAVNGQLLLTVSTVQYTALHSGNYNSYAPTLTGTGASGTWSINVTGSAGSATTATTAANLSTATPIYRTAAGAGYLNGNYSSVETTATSGAIYSIGGAYVPGTTTLGNMYGIGYGYSGGAMGNPGSVPSNIWGMYVASGGTAKIFLDSDAGRGWFASNLYVAGTQVVYNSGTWNISTTGNAATATTATNQSGGTVNATTVTITGSGYVLAATPAVSTAVYGQFGNSTSTTRIGLEGSVAGNTVSGSLAYNSYVGSVQARGLHLIADNTVRATVDASGNFLLGTTTSPAGSKELVLAGDYIEGVVAIGNSSTAQTLSLANGTLQTVTMTGNCTFTMPGLVAGKSFILIVSTGSGSFTASFTSVKWPNNTAPTLTTTASRWDIFTFVCNGSAWYGNSAQAYA